MASFDVLGHYLIHYLLIHKTEAGGAPRKACLTMPGSFSFCLLMLSPLALSLAVSSPVAHSLLVSRSPAFFPVVWCLCHPRRTRARCARMRDSESSPATTKDPASTVSPRLITPRLRMILRPTLRD